MRTIKAEEITKKVRDMCIQATCHITPDIKSALENSLKSEKSDVSKGVIENLLKNAEKNDIVFSNAKLLSRVIQ